MIPLLSVLSLLSCVEFVQEGLAKQGELRTVCPSVNTLATSEQVGRVPQMCFVFLSCSCHPNFKDIHDGSIYASESCVTQNRLANCDVKFLSLSALI